MPASKSSDAEINLLLRYCEEQWRHIRHLEDQRATFTNLVLVISVGVIGFIVQQGILSKRVSILISGYSFLENYFFTTVMIIIT